MIDIEFEVGKCFICKDDCGSSQACSSCMRKLSQDEIHIPVKPKSYSKLVRENIECAYCPVMTSLIEGVFECGIHYCIDHKKQAQNDMIKWLIKSNSVFIKDIKMIFPDLYKVLENGIPLRRSSGLFDSDWKLDKTKVILHKDFNVGWVITFYKFKLEHQNYYANRIVKHIPISILIEEQSYSILFKNMLIKLKKILDNGFYNSN